MLAPTIIFFNDKLILSCKERYFRRALDLQESLVNMIRIIDNPVDLKSTSYTFVVDEVYYCFDIDPSAIITDIQRLFCSDGIQAQ